MFSTIASVSQANMVGPVFRAEESYTHMHLCEYIGLDVEMEIYESYSEMSHCGQEVLETTQIQMLLKHYQRSENLSMMENMPKLLSGEGSNAYQLLGDIKLEFDHNAAAYDEKTYVRELDLNTATAKVGYSVGEVTFTREHFASYPDKVIPSKISGNKSGYLSFTAFLDSKLPHRVSVNAQNQIVMERADAEIQFSAILDIRISDGIGTIFGR